MRSSYKSDVDAGSDWTTPIIAVLVLGIVVWALLRVAGLVN